MSIVKDVPLKKPVFSPLGNNSLIKAMSRVIQTVLIKTSLSIQLTVYVPYGYTAHKFSIKLMLQDSMDVNPSPKKQKPTNHFRYIPD